MLNHFIIFARKTARLVGLATLLWAGHNAGFADKLVQIPKENKTNNPAISEKKNLLDFRAYRPAESIFKTRSIDVPTPSVPGPTPSTRTSKEDRELLDRQKNWIFVLPGDEKKSESTDDLLEMDAAALDGESKSVLTKFLENRTPSPSTEANANSFNKNDSKSAGSQIFGIVNENPNELRPWGPRFENPIGTSGAPMSLAERWQQLHGPGAEKTREEKRIRMSEFESLFSSQSVAGNTFNTFQSGLSLQPSAPLGRVPDRFNRNVPVSDPRNPARPLSNGNPSTQPSINTRVFGSTSTIIPAPEPPREVTQPAVLPIPKRRF